MCAFIFGFHNAHPTHIVRNPTKVNSRRSSSSPVLWKISRDEMIFFYPKKEDRKTICLNGYKRWMQAKQNRDEFHGNQMVRGIFADCWRQKGPKTKRWTNEIENISDTQTYILTASWECHFWPYYCCFFHVRHSTIVLSRKPCLLRTSRSLVAITLH